MFTFDNLNRLMSAYADGGTNNDGDYASAGSPESYTYSTTSGNLSSKAYFTISDASHYVEVDWQGAICLLSLRSFRQTIAAAGANDGRLTFWIDGGQQADLTGIDNDTYSIDYILLGPLAGAQAGAGGVCYLDAFESRRSSYIGQQSGMRTFILGKSMRKAGLMKMMEIKHDVAGRYAPLQEVIVDTPTDFLFTGQRYDSYIDLIWMNSRWYDPVLGRFLQPDPLIPEPFDPAAYDRYAYARNNPLKYVDPTGHIVETSCPGGCIIWDYSNVGGEDVGGQLVRAIISTATELVDFFVTNGATQTDPQSCVWYLAGVEDRFIAGTVPPFLLGVTGGQLILPGFEDLMHTQVSGKLSEAARNAFRKEARSIFYRAYPRLAEQGLEVHHRIPLEWAHLFPEAKPNRLSNLIGLDALIHDKIDLRWDGFRAYYNRLGRTPTAKEILKFAISIDKEFSRYYNRILEKKKR